ncbi:hypothetical protein [Streptomyces sp. 2132.2]|uniref:hypothetical protein n=1 Tax=Streptomyces sp. 2132.2 TaxID=2485161 RepID=UPI0016125B5A|nr:hypothetical protein [Streptomyces sp. 2132.2]
MMAARFTQDDPERAVIPSPAQLRDIRTAGDDRFLLIACLMSGCGMRNGKAFAVNLNNLVADDVYRITEQVSQTTKTYGCLKHRKPFDYRDVPLPARIRETIEWYADKHGTVDATCSATPWTQRSRTSPTTSRISGST